VKIGFAKHDITPRLGVELCGFGPFLCRHATAVRDRLWARAMAVDAGGGFLIVISCDLIGLSLDMTRQIRDLVCGETGVPADGVMVCCSHTHSGPATGPYIGWGEPDAPYCETLPRRVAKAAVKAFSARREAVFAHVEMPCEGIGLNRESDRDAQPLDVVLNDAWRPAKPEHTDTTCHVLAARSGDALLGFVSYFGCHPVVCCAQTRHIHGDYCGVATNQVERDYPGSVGLFIQGAQGDVNTCVVHKPEQESLLALDAIAGRYAAALRRGLAAAKPIGVETLACARRTVTFSRKQWPIETLRGLLADKEARLNHPDATDDFATDEWRLRLELVYAIALRGLVARAERGESLEPPTELHGVRIGPVAILGSPFETFQAIKNEVLGAAKSPIPLVASFVSDSVGYAPDRTSAARGGYAADTVPLICGQLPYANAHDELVAALLELDAELSV
jgi:hypothetical protein